jgi:hypothetical protein
VKLSPEGVVERRFRQPDEANGNATEQQQSDERRDRDRSDGAASGARGVDAGDALAQAIPWNYCW